MLRRMSADTGEQTRLPRIQAKVLNGAPLPEPQVEALLAREGLRRSDVRDLHATLPFAT
jgi:hypothetical protein